jgi:DNA-binding MarR family transcriptional regulator
MTTGLTYELHKLTRLLDRAADSLLREREGLSYSRFLALFAVEQGATTQRDVARWLGQSEPATSQMVGVLVEEGLLNAQVVPGAGNRRQLRLTKQGDATVRRCIEFLEGEFKQLVAQSGVRLAAYQRDTGRLLAHLEAKKPSISAPRRGIA